MNNTRLTAGTAKVDITTLDESHINDRLYGRILTLCQEDITFVIIIIRYWVYYHQQQEWK